MLKVWRTGVIDTAPQTGQATNRQRMKQEATHEQSSTILTGFVYVEGATILCEAGIDRPRISEDTDKAHQTTAACHAMEKTTYTLCMPKRSENRG